MFLSFSPVSLPVCLVPRLTTGVPNAPASRTPQLLFPIIQPAWHTNWMNCSNGMCFTAWKLGCCSMPFFRITRTISLLPVYSERAVRGIQFYKNINNLKTWIKRKWSFETLTSINVWKENKRPLVKRDQCVQHQSVDLNWVLDVCGDWVLQSYNVVMVLHVSTCNMGYHKSGPLRHTRTVMFHYISGCLPSQLLMISM